MLTVFEVFDDFGVAGSDCGLAAPANMGVRQLIEPIQRRVVDGLGDVDSEIEAAVIAASEDEHKLSRLVLDLADPQLRVLLLEVVRVDQGGLVPEVLGTLAEVFGKQRLGLLLEDVGLVGRNAVPELGLALVEVVDG